VYLNLEIFIFTERSHTSRAGDVPEAHQFLNVCHDTFGEIFLKRDPAFSIRLRRKSWIMKIIWVSIPHSLVDISRAKVFGYYLDGSLDEVLKETTRDIIKCDTGSR